MDINSFLNSLGSTANPLLPSLAVTRVALYVVWAIVLGSGTLLLAGKLARRYQLGLSVLVMAWTLMPGSASPAYWLGLAFQTPSLMSAVICLRWALSRARPGQAGGAGVAQPPIHALKILAAAGIVLGWVLLLDTLAWLPVSVYAWGFGSAALGVAAAFATLLWAVLATAAGAGENQLAPGRVGLLLTVSVLAIFVLTRLPTGNVWDALIDPWLWVALQGGWIVSAARRRIAVQHPSPAARA